ncbi:alpha/beta fold hydrolase [Luteimonas sp. S4-F44]|uniref:alpha/beta fold hydrolase n=1 Tax=Luteimonas sp. S4-F44 TaxID=2925842 RepID=UPI001F53C366|nr:alpha/beta fold hydrolase [Luteimonas sp. S4-F44]UNK41590.1 alpha/beta fold hydrolase [Luteimonas sp. S4-F44]
MAERTPLLLLPGLLCDARLWRDVVDGVSDLATPQLADLTRDDSVGDMAERVLAAAPPRFALAGLSMGGYVAFEILRRQPQRVARLALLDTSAAPDPPTRAAQRRAGLALLARGRFAGVTRQMLPRLVHPRHVDGPVGEAVRAMAERVGADAYRRQQAAILARPDSRPLLASIAVPTLVVVGADDAMTPPAESHVLQRGIAGARLATIPDCGHLPPMEAPETTCALLREWLRD